MRQLLDVAYALWADDPSGPYRRSKLDEHILASLPDRDTWGTDPAAQRAARAMMAAAGGPAPRRPKPEPEGTTT